MNYELAKELKDAGFWKSEYVNNWLDTFHKEGRIEMWEEVATSLDFLPTLSELIEACGDRSYTLVKMIIDGEEVYSFCESGGGFGCDYGKGSTPEEAVAQLWLAINKK